MRSPNISEFPKSPNLGLSKSDFPYRALIRSYYQYVLLELAWLIGYCPKEPRLVFQCQNKLSIEWSWSYLPDSIKRMVTRRWRHEHKSVRPAQLQTIGGLYKDLARTLRAGLLLPPVLLTYTKPEPLQPTNTSKVVHIFQSFSLSLPVCSKVTAALLLCRSKSELDIEAALGSENW